MFFIFIKRTMLTCWSEFLSSNSVKYFSILSFMFIDWGTFLLSYLCGNIYILPERKMPLKYYLTFLSVEIHFGSSISCFQSQFCGPILSLEGPIWISTNEKQCVRVCCYLLVSIPSIWNMHWWMVLCAKNIEQSYELVYGLLYILL